MSDSYLFPFAIWERNSTYIPSPRWGEGKGEGLLMHLVIGNWDLFGVWNLVIGILDAKRTAQGVLRVFAVRTLQRRGCERKGEGYGHCGK
jgi:hypothetical protein